jgi:hypothetical protein
MPGGDAVGPCPPAGRAGALSPAPESTNGPVHHPQEAHRPARDLSGTDVGEVAIDLAGIGGIGDAQADTVSVNATNGDDTVSMIGSGSELSVPYRDNPHEYLFFAMSDGSGQDLDHPGFGSPTNADPPYQRVSA